MIKVKSKLPRKELLRLRKERVKIVDETFGGEEGQAEVQPTYETRSREFECRSQGT